MECKLKGLLRIAMLLSSLIVFACAVSGGQKPLLDPDDYALVKVPRNLIYPQAQEEAAVIALLAVSDVDPGEYRQHHVAYSIKEERWMVMVTPNDQIARGFPGYTVLIERLDADESDTRCYALVFRTP